MRTCQGVPGQRTDVPGQPSALAGGDGRLSVAIAGLLRGLVLATRDLAGPAWLEASGDDPDIAAFTTLQASPSPPHPDRIDEICSRVLWARFGPADGTRDSNDDGGAQDE